MAITHSLYDLFRKCTVSIFTSAGSQGTGFFVAPGLILTCAHVIKSDKSAQLPSVTIQWNQQSYKADIEQLCDPPYPDIALLSIASPDYPTHPYVVLDEEIEIADELYCYGYPDDYPDGDSVTLRYEGPTERQGQLIKLKEGQVRPGLSGAPLLNTRTRRVCGIMKLTRDRGAALGGRAIPTTVVFQEFAQIKIARHELDRNNRQWYKALAATKPTHLLHEATGYFAFLNTFLEFEGQWLQDDFKKGRIYVPQKEYFAQLKKVLDTKKRALLSGPSAAGKTVLAITFAQHLQEHEGYTVCYKDVKQARPGDGRKWHALMLAHDYPGLLYILDNCHLLPEEVYDFCEQWISQSPKYTQCLLISRSTSLSQASLPHADTAVTQSPEEGSYFRLFAHDEKIPVLPEKIFWQVIEQYAASLSSQDNAYLETLKSDNQEKLAQQHKHNLVISRGYLDTWQALGASHYLSEVQPQDTYHMLAEKYLSAHETTLARLCVLQRYEIRMHNSFIKQFPADEIKLLEDEKLLIHSKGATGYGQLYDLMLHASEAKELVRAYVYNQHDSLQYISDFVLSTLEAYLKARPDNYIAVYESLARHKQNAILKQLLENPEVQQYTASQLKNKETVLDAIRYTYHVARFDRTRALKLINDIMHIPGIKIICTSLLKSSFHDISLYMQYINYIDRQSAQDIANSISSNIVYQNILVQKATEENIQSIFRLIRTLQEQIAMQEPTLLQLIPLEKLAAKITIHNLQDTIKQLQKYQYAPERLQQLISLLDMPQLALQSKTTSLQSLFWTLHTLKKVSWTQAQQLMQVIPLQVLATQASTSNPGSIDHIIRNMQEFGYSSEHIRSFVEQLDMQQIAQRTIRHMKQGTLRHLITLLRTLKAISDASATKLLDAFSTEDISALLQHTSLKVVGLFLQDHYTNRQVQEAYAHFQIHTLPQQLASTPLAEINQLLGHLSRIRHVGPQLAHHALTLFAATDTTDLLAQADLPQYIQLLQYAHALDAASASRLLMPLVHTASLQSNLAKHDLHSIQLLIHNIALIDAAYLSTLRQTLLALNIPAKFTDASLRDIGYFLWNVYSFIDRALASQYSVYVDQHLPVQRIMAAPSEDVCLLLWHIVSISNAPTSRLLAEQVIHNLLHIWHNQPGWSLVLAGIVTMTQDPLRAAQYMVDRQIAVEALLPWLTAGNGEKNLYFLALALQGLRAYDEHIACTIVCKRLRLSRIRDRLHAAKQSAITAHSITLIEGILQWLEQLSVQRH